MHLLGCKQAALLYDASGQLSGVALRTWDSPMRMAAPVMKPLTWAWLRKLVTQPAEMASRVE